MRKRLERIERKAKAKDQEIKVVWRLYTDPAPEVAPGERLISWRMIEDGENEQDAKETTEGNS